MAISRDMLRVKGLGKIFFNGAGEREPKVVLKNLGFDLGENDSLAVMGPSGCGKTTLLLMIAGLVSPTEGSIRLDDEEVWKPSRKTALVLQEYGLFPWKSVAANITLGALKDTDVTLAIPAISFTAAEWLDRYPSFKIGLDSQLPRGFLGFNL